MADTTRATEATLAEIKTAAEALSALIDSDRLKVDPAGVVLTAIFNANGGQAETDSSGVTAKTTSSDAAVTVIAADGSQDYYNLRVFNEGSVSGFFSSDGGTTWHRLPAFSVVEMQTLISNVTVQVKRIAGGDNLSGVYASVW